MAESPSSYGDERDFRRDEQLIFYSSKRQIESNVLSHLYILFIIVLARMYYESPFNNRIKYMPGLVIYTLGTSRLQRRGALSSCQRQLIQR